MNDLDLWKDIYTKRLWVFLIDHWHDLGILPEDRSSYINMLEHMLDFHKIPCSEFCTKEFRKKE